MTPTRTQALGLLAALALTSCSHDDSEAAHGFETSTRQDMLYKTSGRTLSSLTELNMGFGSTVALDGEQVVVGAPGARAFQGLAYTIVESSFSPGEWIQDETFQFFEGMSNEYAGTSLALRGNTFVIGAPNAETGFSRTGTAYVSTIPNGTRTPAELRSSGVDEDRFGEAVEVLQNTIFVGAPLTRPEGFSGNPGPGVVYVYERGSEATPWTNRPDQDDTLFAPDRGAGDGFGSAISASGEYAAVGAPTQGVDVKPGAVYVYNKVNGDWYVTSENEPTKLDEDAGGPAAVNGARFGASVSLKDNFLLVGAPGASPDAQGVAVLYERTSGNTWAPSHRFENPNPEADSEFGAAVSMDGNRALIGAPGATDGGEALGLAYVFERDGQGGWTLLQTLHAAGAAPSLSSPGSARFGQSVALQGDRAIVGAPSSREDVGGGPNDNVGSVYVFTFDDSPVEPDAGMDTGPNVGVDTGAPVEDTGSDVNAPPPRAPQLVECSTTSPGAPEPTNLAWLVVVALLGLGKRRHVWRDPSPRT